MKYSTKTFATCVFAFSFLVSGCATITDEDYLERLEKSAMLDRHEEFEQQLLPIHQRSEIIRQEIEEVEKRKKVP